MRAGQKFGVCFLLFFCLITPALADSARIAQVKTVVGDAFITRNGERHPAKPGDALYQSDVVTTGSSSAIGFTFIDNTVFSEGPDSELALEQFHFDANAAKGDLLADMRKGSLTVVSGEITHTSPEAMKIKTPTSVLGVRGTTFAVRVY
ncbi:MAG TPA: FecR domain-containing protein [Stellaceae bacterium]|nr:FecR domain-containing protein [Stellaceae bacterium]